MKNLKQIHLTKSIYLLLLFLLFAVFSFLLTYRVTEIPVPYNVDEAGMAYDAWSLANYHVDRYLYHFPVYLINFGGGQSVLYAYLTAALIKLFGFSVLIVRLPAILLSLLSAFVFVLIIKKEHGMTASVVLMGFLCILPFSVMHSRWGLDAYLLYPMMIFSSSALYRAIKTGKTRWFLLSGFLFGTTLYSYIISFMVIPVFLGITVVCLIVIRKIRWKNIFALVCPLFLLSIPLLLMLAVNNGYIEEIRTPLFSVPKLFGFRSGEIGLQNLVNNLKFDSYNIFYEIFANDHCRYNVIPRFGTLYYISIPILVYSLFHHGKKELERLKNRKFSLETLMLLLLLSAFAVSILIERPNVNRSCTIYISLIYFLSFGFIKLMERNHTVGFVTAILYLINFVFFIQYYFVEFPKDLDSDFLFSSVSDLKAALEFSETIYQDDETVYVVGKSNPYIYTILALQIDPYDFNEKKILTYEGLVKYYDKYRFQLDAILPDCIYIFRDRNEISENIERFGFLSEQFGSVMVYYPEIQ